MAIFNLAGCVTVSVYTTVEADSLEQAIKIAEGRSVKRYQWNDKESVGEFWINEEYDGEVQEITNNE